MGWIKDIVLRRHKAYISQGAPRRPETVPVDAGPIDLGRIRPGSSIALNGDEYTEDQIKQFVMTIAMHTMLPVGADWDQDERQWVIEIMERP